jgi:hypothetical protein
LNLGGFDISDGIGKRIQDLRLNFGVARILGLNRTIEPEENPAFPGKYGGRGAMLRIGVRW